MIKGCQKHEKNTQIPQSKCDITLGKNWSRSLKDFSDLKSSIDAESQSDNSHPIKSYGNWRDESKKRSYSLGCNSELNVQDKQFDVPTVQMDDSSVEELAAYFDDKLFLPRKMSFMAEMMYT